MPPLRFVSIVPLLLLVSLAALAPAGRADLVLNEILYDPDGSDEGREFVELWNPDSLAAPLDGVSLETSDGARPGTWVVVWRAASGETAPPRAAYLVGPERLLAALQNGPDAIRLVRGGVLLDLLGYGDLGDASQFEGSPAADAPSGASLARVADGIDSGVNREDWAPQTEPTPGEANHPETRLRFGRALPALAPAVPWPGEPFEARASIRNAGTLRLDGSRWRLVAEIAERASGIWSELGARAGVAIAPGESVSVAVSLTGPAAGAHRLRLRVEASSTADGSSTSGGASSGGGGSGSDAVALADTAGLWLRSFASPAVVSEVAFHGTGAGEWVEIWARERIDDVEELTLADAASHARAIDRGAAPRALAAGSYLVVAQDPAAVRSRFGLPDSAVVGVVGGWPSLNDDAPPGLPADRVTLALTDGVPVDAMTYFGDETVRGGSLERLSSDLPSGAPGSWSESVAPEGGTPGRANSMRAPGGPAPGGRALLVAGARVLSARAGDPAPIVFRVTEAARGRRLTVRVHDLLGRPVRTLTDGQRLATDAAFVWSGADDRGDPAPPGLYVVRAEALPEDGAAPLASTLSIAIAGGRP